MVERAFQTSTWLQVSRNFRQDVHAALTVKQSEDGSRLDVVTPDGPITWLADGEKIRRIIQRPPSEEAVDSPAINSLPGEQYVFVDNVARLSLTVGASGTATLASIEVTPFPTPNGDGAPANVTVAVVGLDNQFLARVTAAEEQS